MPFPELHGYIQIAKKDIFKKDYEKEATDTETLGIIVSRFLKWETDEIVDCFISALIDANQAKLAEKIEKVVEKNESQR